VALLVFAGRHYPGVMTFESRLSALCAATRAPSWAAGRANLNCGIADTRTRNDGADEWCRVHPNDANIPAAATSHSTIGFEVGNWQVLN
jgi:hypothetical protein